MEVVGFSGDSTPDVIWVVRKINIPGRGIGLSRTRELWGLFACYRRPASDPGEPTCYLAKTVWDPKDLDWPNPIQIQNGKLLIPELKDSK